MLGSFLGRQVKGAVGKSSKTEDDSVASEVNQFNSALLAWLKSNSGARCQIQAHAVCCSPVKAQAGIGLCKVIVRSHLYGPIAGVLNHQGASSSAHIERVLTIVDEEFAGCHELAFKLG